MVSRHCYFVCCTYLVCMADVTPTKTLRMVVQRMVLFVVSVLVLRENLATPWTNSLELLFPGVFLTLGTDTTIGLGSMGGWSGMASSRPQLPTQSRWENRYVGIAFFSLPPLSQYSLPPMWQFIKKCVLKIIRADTHQKKKKNSRPS